MSGNDLILDRTQQEIDDEQLIALVQSEGWRYYKSRIKEIVDEKKVALLRCDPDKFIPIRSEIVGIEYVINLAEELASELLTEKQEGPVIEKAG